MQDEGQTRETKFPSQPGIHRVVGTITFVVPPLSAPASLIQTLPSCLWQDAVGMLGDENSMLYHTHLPPFEKGFSLPGPPILKACSMEGKSFFKT